MVERAVSGAVGLLRFATGTVWAGFGQANAWPSPGEGDGTGPHQPIRRGEQHVQVVEIFADPAVAGLRPRVLVRRVEWRGGEPQSWRTRSRALDRLVKMRCRAQHY